MGPWHITALLFAALLLSDAVSADQNQDLLQTLQLTPAQQKEVQCLARLGTRPSNAPRSS